MAKMGRPPKLTDDLWQQVLGAVASGANMRLAAEVIGFTRRGLQKAIARSVGKRRDLADAREVANGLIEKKIFDMAQNGDRTMLIWWSKNKMGWKDRVERTGEVEVRNRVYRSHISTEDKVDTREEGADGDEKKEREVVH